ncbi:hypothetical protein V3C99_012989 [Haemonchus contortus]|uniref:Neur_chan_memb domain-containing protein n=1 Tax=Haemonchus contortus TaxID=6289 RepID=A0A7I5E733_HAECO
MDTHVAEKSAPLTDVSLTVRAGLCLYMTVLAMYLNTLLFILIHYKVIQVRQAAKAVVVVSAQPAEPKVEEKVSVEPEEPAAAWLELQKTQTLEKTEEKEDLEAEKAEKLEKRDKTLKSARMSIRLPRAPKGHHVEELDQMEKFLAEDEGP